MPAATDHTNEMIVYIVLTSFPSLGDGVRRHFYDNIKFDKTQQKQRLCKFHCTGAVLYH